jgi:hypothetical protein
MTVLMRVGVCMLMDVLFSIMTVSMFMRVCMSMFVFTHLFFSDICILYFFLAKHFLILQVRQNSTVSGALVKELKVAFAFLK